MTNGDTAYSRLPPIFVPLFQSQTPVDDAVERGVVVGLLRRTADQVGLIGDYAVVNALLVAALRLIDPGDTTTLIEVHTGLWVPNWSSMAVTCDVVG